MVTTSKTVQDRLLSALQKTWGADAVQRLGDGGSRCDVHTVIPTGIDVVDHHVLGIGGFPGGRLTELSGPEGGGKSSLYMAAIGAVQRLGGVAHIVETEHALQTARVTTLGGDAGAVILHQPDNLEDALGHIESIVAALPAELPALIAWDSVAATPTRAEAENGVAPEKEGMAEFARIMSRALRTLVGVLATKRAALVCVNQQRSKVGIVFGDPTTTPGGAALKYYASVRLSVSGGTKVCEKGDTGAQVGRDALVKCIKHKLYPPFREARVRLVYASGWDNRWSTVNHAKDLELVGIAAKLTDATERAALKALAADTPAGKGWAVDPARYAEVTK